MNVALQRGYVNAIETEDVCARYEEIARMTTGLIRHLKKEDRKDRG